MIGQLLTTRYGVRCHAMASAKLRVSELAHPVTAVKEVISVLTRNSLCIQSQSLSYEGLPDGHRAW
jgi:hypothetical protein